jgi:hypothetical protein
MAQIADPKEKTIGKRAMQMARSYFVGLQPVTKA